jgi:hypothetical protein
MNRRSCGYLVRALNEFASLAGRCGLNDVRYPVPAKVPIRTDGVSRKSRRLCRRSAQITRHVIQKEQLSHCRKKYQ